MTTISDVQSQVNRVQNLLEAKIVEGLAEFAIIEGDINEIRDDITAIGAYIAALEARGCDHRARRSRHGAGRTPLTGWSAIRCACCIADAFVRTYRIIPQGLVDGLIETGMMPGIRPLPLASR